MTSVAATINEWAVDGSWVIDIETGLDLENSLEKEKKDLEKEKEEKGEKREKGEIYIIDVSSKRNVDLDLGICVNMSLRVAKIMCGTYWLLGVTTFIVMIALLITMQIRFIINLVL